MGMMRDPPADAKDGVRTRRARRCIHGAPTMAVPAGGGAIRGMGEKFTANPVTGTASLGHPDPCQPGALRIRAAACADLRFRGGNGPFGFGWSLALPAITRKTDKGLPRYLDAEESDVFVLSGAEDLVPELRTDGTRFRDDHQRSAAM